MLEVIDKGSSTESHPVPLLFVHGAWHAAWCWDDGFLEFFADQGFRVLALSLRGHGGSPARRRLRFISFADYLQDVAAVAADLPTPPVLVGHSMGGEPIVSRSAERTFLVSQMLLPYCPVTTTDNRRAINRFSSGYLLCSLRSPSCETAWELI